MGTCVGRIARLVLVAGVVVAAVVASAVPAMAKMPPFDLEVSSDRVAPWETVTVRVTTYQFGAHEERVPLDFTSEPLTDLIGVYPTAAFDEQRGWAPESDHDLLTLHRVAPGVFEGSFRAPKDGAVMVVPFPGTFAPHLRSSGGVFSFDEERAAELGYPMPVTVTVASATPLPSWLLVAPALVVVLGVLAARRQRVVG